MRAKAAYSKPALKESILDATLRHETDLSTQQTEARQQARLSSPHEVEERPQGPQAASEEGAQDTYRQRQADRQVAAALTEADVDRPADEDSTPFHGLPRTFRLKRQRLIRPLFDRTRSDVGTISRGSIRILYRIVPREAAGANVPIQVGFAPGRIDKATRRNRIKRILREVYRVRQRDLVDLFSHTDAALTLMILYRGPGDGAEARIRDDLPRVLDRLASELRSAKE